MSPTHRDWRPQLSKLSKVGRTPVALLLQSSILMQFGECETASGLYKNRIYGMGSFFTSSLRPSTLRPLSASVTSRSVDPEESIDLRLRVQELTQNLYEQVQELNETRERYQEILTHVMGTNELILEWRKKLEQLQQMEQQMAVYETQMRANDSGTTGETQISLPSLPSQ
nr:uncharacterized protein LOC112698042 [Arachis hypogaea]